MLNPKKIKAREVMNSELQTLTDDMPIKEAVQTLAEYHISGAPVVNAAGECVGVFSTSDVLKRDAEIEDRETPRAGDFFAGVPVDEDVEDFRGKEDYDEEMLGRDTVGQWMTAEISSIGPESTLDLVCRRMLEENIHRILVMDGQKKLLGMISTSDVVRLVAL
jgi:CBS domain-containing protein